MLQPLLCNSLPHHGSPWLNGRLLLWPSAPGPWCEFLDLQPCWRGSSSCAAASGDWEQDILPAPSSFYSLAFHHVAQGCWDITIWKVTEKDYYKRREMFLNCVLTEKAQKKIRVWNMLPLKTQLSSYSCFPALDVLFSNQRSHFSKTQHLNLLEQPTAKAEH